MSIYRRDAHVPFSDVHAMPIKSAGIVSHKEPAESSPQSLRPTLESVPANVLAMRKPQQPANVLLRYTAQWAATLPPKEQPRSLMAVFPRVANVVALLWTEPTR